MAWLPLFLFPMRPPGRTMERARAAAQSRPDSLLRSVGWILLYLRGRGVLENAETITSMCLPDVRPQFAPDAKPINILCIDGGGIRGRNLMVMVEELEKALGRPLAGEFDLVAGSSIGSNASNLVRACRMTASGTAMDERTACAAQPELLGAQIEPYSPLAPVGARAYSALAPYWQAPPWSSHVT